MADFFDDFNRPKGPVDNGWSDTPGPESLVIQHHALTNLTTTAAGIYRPIDMSHDIRVSEHLTEQNGFGGLHDRFTSAILFGSDGTANNGLGIHVARGDENYDDSRVVLTYNGTNLETIFAPFQFHSSITIKATFHEATEKVTGSIRCGSDHFHFAFSPQDVALDGSNLELYQDGVDDRAGSIIYPTIDNVSIDEIPGPTDAFAHLSGAHGPLWSDPYALHAIIV